MEKSPVTPCPDAETLAAWLDHGLDDHERAGVTAHVAACDDCRGIVANVLKLQDADAEPEEASSKKPKGLLDLPAASLAPEQPVMTGTHGKVPWSKITWGGGVLAAAAAVLLAVNLQPRLADRWRTDDAEDRLAELAQATDGQRTVEGRLTGGFGYGPLRAPVRSAAGTAAPNDWALLAAAAKISEEAEKSPVAANLHGLGLAALVLGDHDEAISALEDATSEEPETGRYQSDLAAAYLARAQAADRPDDLTRGLTAAERALKADGDLLEARFNRALALERLYLTDQARKAWQEYLEHDPSSPWSEEARQHLQALPEGKSADDQARNNSPPEVTETTVEAALEWLLRTGLPTWAEAVLAGNLQKANHQQTRLVAHASSITQVSGDPFALALTPRSAENARTAEAVRAFGTSLSRLSALASEDEPLTETELRPICDALREPLASLCGVELGTIAALHRNDRVAALLAERALAVARQGGYHYLEGRALRLEGYRPIMSGNTAAALQPYRDAYAAFERGRYLVQIGTVSTQVADLLYYTGLSDEAWRWRLIGLRAAAEARSPYLDYVTRGSAVVALLSGRGQPEAGAVFSEAISDTSILPAVMRIGRQLRRAESSMALGDYGSARTAAENARSLLETSGDYRVQRRRSELLLELGRIAAAENRLGDAEAALSEALSLLGPEKAPQRAAALLARARVRLKHQQVASAESDVSMALATLADRAGNGAWQPLRLDDAPAAFEAIGDLVASQATLQGLRGLQLVESLRQLLDGVPAEQRVKSASELDKLIAKLRPGQTVVYFLFQGERGLLVWTLSPHGQVAFERLDLSSEDVARLSNALTVQIVRTPEQEETWRSTLADLYDQLLAPLPAIGASTDLVVVPDGVLNRVPFGALYDRTRRQFVFEQHAVRVAPNLLFAAGAVAQPTSQKVAGSVLVVGEPALRATAGRRFERLPRARAEATAIAGLYPVSTTLVGERATKAQLLGSLGAGDVLHFAGHAVVPTGNDGPRLLLAGSVEDASTGLRAGDLKNHRSTIPSRVVLAACETGTGPVDRAAGVVSLAAVFLRAGTASVAGTLWPVGDRGSEEFFVALHRGLIAGLGMPRAIAHAQRECRSSLSCRKAAATYVGTTAFGAS